MNKIISQEFARTSQGEAVHQFILRNENGMQLEIINFGAIITSIFVPDKDGKFEDVVLGFKNPEDYFNSNQYTYGAVVGRYANRISNARFAIDGREYQVTKNEGNNHIHGGKEGFANKIWRAEILEKPECDSLALYYHSADGEEGFPGNLSVTVIYTLRADNALEIEYSAETDRATVINLTQHSYFNLSGKHSAEITDHELQIHADYFLPIDGNSIPTGKICSVKNTPFDFNIMKEIGRDINHDHEQLVFGNGYDHCWVLKESESQIAGNLYHRKSGRNMEILTTEPGIQLYTGNFLDGKYETKTGGYNTFRTGLCLETQHFPNSPNQDHFPSTILNAGEFYKSKTIFRFSVRS
ncbi:aldose epimerase family protein [Chryseobacterium sp. Leaf394]|uniref:aldose epimerase family protein n=1 Tax=Chryseobacterium sp. Leaf394 TaxID=1736361 RepID=UPI0006F849A2|nr:aldose epimerase family protein [Chryseobacterium sp. Leaf394]KQS92449.1 aldose epimerase [Chryseobacterium sp. Leaf394]